MTLWRVTHKGTNPQRYHLSHCQNKNTELHWASWWRNADGSVAHHTWSNRPNRTTHPTHSPRQKDMGDLWKWWRWWWKNCGWSYVSTEFILDRWGKKKHRVSGIESSPFQASKKPYQQFISEQSPFTVAVLFMMTSNNDVEFKSNYHLTTSSAVSESAGSFPARIN